jgi:hypothetical protein
MLDVQIQLARKRIASECNGFDPFYNEVMKGLGFNFEPTKPVLRNRDKLSSRFTSASMPSIRFRLKEQWPFYATAARAMASNSEARFPAAFKAQPFGGVRTILRGAEGELCCQFKASFRFRRRRPLRGRPRGFLLTTPIFCAVTESRPPT